ncbi:MAG: M28 family peptidase, partial [Gammaproteobacteria bacterium]|nr:M28 family peptidase [Gammaproteobacteria bacterium]
MKIVKTVLALTLIFIVFAHAPTHTVLGAVASVNTSDTPDTPDAARGDSPLLGFTEAGARAQRSLEKKFDARLQAGDIRTWMQHMSAEPHHVGSPYGEQNARYLADLFEGWGYQVAIERYEILLPVPVTRVVELIEPVRFTASLVERSLAEDPSTDRRENLLPPYNAFSVDGDVTAELVYVNYGVQEDYEELERFGIDVAGKIVIARYGKVWRGIKPKLAAEHGAIGAIIYSDPADDGYVQGDVYPNGAFKNDSGVQRGAVMDLPLHAGDVLTPGRAATKRARRLRIDAAPAITKIPVLPISYADAEPLLTALDGPVAPSGWRGALPITYHLGPGAAKVRLAVKFDWGTVTANNVIATLEGSAFPDQWVIRGNHHDGWNHGARDPLSGMASLLAEAKSVAALARNGHPPARTIVYAAWDAEEPGLIGSTEWVEDHARELDRKAVAYINTDGMGRGFVYLGGSHTLERFYNQVIADVTDPQTGVSVADRRRAVVRTTGDEKARAELESRADLRISPLGSGSDYTPFLQHLGIASSNIAFGGESAHGSYHTLYDTYEHFSRFGDPGHVYGVTLAQVAGRATLRL